MHIVPSLTVEHRFFVFRPIGHGHYKEIQFEIIHGQIVDQKHCKLHQFEKDYIKHALIV